MDGWHARVHVIETERTLHTGEGGWCVPMHGNVAEVEESKVVVVSQGLRSEIIDGTRVGGGAHRADAGHAPVLAEHRAPRAQRCPRTGQHVLKSLIYIVYRGLDLRFKTDKR